MSGFDFDNVNNDELSRFKIALFADYCMLPGNSHTRQYAAYAITSDMPTRPGYDKRIAWLHSIARINDVQRALGNRTNSVLHGMLLWRLIQEFKLVDDNGEFDIQRSGCMDSEESIAQSEAIKGVVKRAAKARTPYQFNAVLCDLSNLPDLSNLLDQIVKHYCEQHALELTQYRQQYILAETSAEPGHFDKQRAERAYAKSNAPHLVELYRHIRDLSAQGSLPGSIVQGQKEAEVAILMTIALQLRDEKFISQRALRNTETRLSYQYDQPKTRLIIDRLMANLDGIGTSDAKPIDKLLLSVYAKMRELRERGTQNREHDFTHLIHYAKYMFLQKVVVHIEENGSITKNELDSFRNERLAIVGKTSSQAKYAGVFADLRRAGKIINPAKDERIQKSLLSAETVEDILKIKTSSNPNVSVWDRLRAKSTVAVVEDLKKSLPWSAEAKATYQRTMASSGDVRALASPAAATVLVSAAAVGAKKGAESRKRKAETPMTGGRVKALKAGEAVRGGSPVVRPVRSRVATPLLFASASPADASVLVGRDSPVISSAAKMGSSLEESARPDQPDADRRDLNDSDLFRFD